MKQVDYNEVQAVEADLRHAELIKMYREGATPREIAIAYEIGESRVYAILRRARRRGLLKEGE